MTGGGEIPIDTLIFTGVEPSTGVSARACVRTSVIKRLSLRIEYVVIIASARRT